MAIRTTKGPVSYSREAKPDDPKPTVKAAPAKKPRPEIDHDKVAKVNADLAAKGDSKRLHAEVRHSEIAYRWAHLVPERELTPEELKAVGV